MFGNVTLDEILAYSEFASAVGRELIPSEGSKKEPKPLKGDSKLAEWTRTVAVEGSEGSKKVAKKLQGLKPLSAEDFGVIDRALATTAAAI